ncbi:MAG: radical SAM protein [bacterium]
MILGLSNDVIVRKESFGGVIFNKNNGVTIELDKEAYKFVKLFRTPMDVETISNKEALNIVKTLFAKGILIETLNRYKKDEKEGGYPYVVYLGVTSNCNFNCPCCYRVDEKEMPKDELFRLIDELCSLGVFQLAIGGGEPFLRPDIFEIIEYCQGKIVCNITTNGFGVKENIGRLKGLVQQINVSLNGFSPLTNIGRDSHAFGMALEAINILSNFKINFGVNILVVKESLLILQKTFKFLVQLGVKKVVILRPKRNKNLWFKTNRLKKEDCERLKEILEEWEEILDIHIDCSLMELMKDIPDDKLLKCGIFGCQQSSTICSITPEGYILPCSFLKTPLGKFTEGSFKEIWHLEQFRRLREKTRKVNRLPMCEV